MTIDVLMLPGTGYPKGGDGVCESFLRGLDRSRFAPRIVAYPAAFGGISMPYPESVRIGKRALADAIRATPNRVVVGGFSQGAGIAGDLAAEIGRGEHPDLEVAACALIADPSRPPGAGMPGRPVTGGYGISGARPIAGIPTLWAAVPGDPITALPEGSPLRSIADLVTWYSVRSPVDAFRWADQLYRQTLAGKWQPWWALRNWMGWGGVVGFAANYLAWGYHGTRYVTERYCADLAAAVNEAVTE